MTNQSDASASADRATHEPSPDGLGHSVGIPSAHTPGPWLRIDTPDYAEIHAAFRPSSQALALVGKPADADLIAAVPELLEALEWFHSFGCPNCGGDCASANPPVNVCPMRVASAAIAKARGAA